MRLVVCAVGGVVRHGGGGAAGAACVDQRLESDEVDGFLEPFADFVLDACAEVVRTIRVAKGHQPSIARSPAASDTGVSPNVEKNADGSQVLSSSSMRSWSGVSG